MIKWIVKRVIANPNFIQLIIEVVVACSDRQITQAEQELIKARVGALVKDWFAGR